MKIIAAIHSNILSGIIGAIDPPAKAPSKLESTRAQDEPRNTANGLFVAPLNANVANWVLSPNSARNTVEHVESNSGKTISF